MSNILRIQDAFYFIKDLPLRIWNLLLRSLAKRPVFSSDPNLSDSDSTKYSNFVLETVNSEKHFSKFRRNFYYRQILEHVDFQLGLKYLRLLKQESLESLKDNSTILNLNKVGHPRLYFYPKLGLISPTLIRYKFVAQELERLFGDISRLNVAEIGVGFGGQFAVLSSKNRIGKYFMFDLPQVISLTKKVLKNAEVDASEVVVGDIENPSVENCDLVISNYAFSELPRGIQKTYLEQVLKMSSRGYLTMNSGRTNFSGRSEGKYSLEELRGLLPEFEVIEENPNTGADNYLIVWGHNN